MSNINNFSPNMLKTFAQCQKKFFLKYIERLSVPTRALMFQKGKKIHALANYYLKGMDISKMEKTLSSEEKLAWESLKANKYFGLKVIGTEYNLSCKVGKYWVGGRLDAFMVGSDEADSELQSTTNQDVFLNLIQNRIDERPCDPESSSGRRSAIEPRNDYYILDYKTGNIPANAENDFQTIVYLLCADKFLKRPILGQSGVYDSLKFIYLGLKKNDEKEIILNENLKKAYEEKIVSTCDKICFAQDSGVFPKCADSCATCEYSKICNGN